MYCETLHSIGHGRTPQMLAIICNITVATNFTDMYLSRKLFGEVMMPIDEDAIMNISDDQTIAQCTRAMTSLLLMINSWSSSWATLPTAHPADVTLRAYHWASSRVESDVNAQRQQCFNMYIARKELFWSLCSMGVPVDWVTARTDMSTYTKILRTPGHLTERLFNIWRMWHAACTEGKLKVKELAVHSLLLNPEPFAEVYLFKEKPEIASQNVVLFLQQTTTMFQFLPAGLTVWKCWSQLFLRCGRSQHQY